MLRYLRVTNFAILSDVAIEQQELIEVTQRRELACHRPAIHLVVEQMLKKIPHVLALGFGQ